MKTIYILSLFTFLMLAACNDQKGIRLSLEQAEKYLDINTDSSLVFLNTIKHPERLTNANWAKYELLHTTVQMRKNQKQETDSLLLKAAQIFITEKDSIRAAKTFYRAGLINMYLNKSERADSLFSAGTPYAIEPDIRYLLYQHAGYSNLNLQKPQQALTYFLKGLEDTTMLSPTLQSLLFGDLGQGYRYTNNTDSCVYYFHKAIRKSEEINSPERAAYYHARISEIYKEQGNISEAIEQLKTSLDLGNKRLDIPINMLAKAEIFLAAGKVDSASVYLQKAIQTPNMFIATRAYELLASMYEGNNNDSSTFTLWKNYNQSLKNLINNYSSTAMARQYQDEKLKNENNELKLKQSQQDIYFLILCLSFVTICGLAYIIYIRDRKRKLQREKEQKEQELKNQVFILEQERELLSLQEKTTALREQLFRRLSISEKIPSLLGKQKQSADEIKSRLTSEDIDELMDTVNNIWPDFAKRLESTYPLLRPKDITFCCLLKSGISAKDLASIYYVTPSAISQKKIRMKREKFRMSDDSVSLDDIIKDF